jgi:D-cysteine desulfhydrase
VAELPLLARFPALGTLPRASFGTYPTPVERLTLADGRTLLLKRDDIPGRAIGGNKIRGLEWLLGSVVEDDRILTIGPRGSTHALATARCARLLGAHTTVVRWNQEMNDAARRVDDHLRRAARAIDAHWVPVAYMVASALRLRHSMRWIPAGGLSPVALLGHVNAGMELADQIARGELEPPARVVVPLGTGGTAAGLALGFRIAGVASRVVAVRVVPRILGRQGRVLRLARSVARLIERLSGARLPRVAREHVDVAHSFYGGAYGRPLLRREDERSLASSGIAVDDTYSRKAYAAALAQRDHRTLLWLTFDGRLLIGE